jgi:Uma2 family endonuclease
MESAPAVSGSMDLEEFTAFMEMRPGKEYWELIEGIAVLMAPVTLAHRQIAHNLCNLLNSALEARHLDCYAYMNVAVRVPGVRNFQSQPDATIVPGIASYDVYSELFRLVAEVLSPTNNRQEIDLKLRRYREAPDNLYMPL